MKEMIIKLIFPIVFLILLLPLTSSVAPETITLENSRVRLTFLSTDAGLYLTEFRNLQDNTVFTSNNITSLIILQLRTSTGNQILITPTRTNSAFSWSPAAIGSETQITFNFNDVQIDSSNNIDISARVVIESNSDKARFYLDINTNTPGYSLYRALYPNVFFNKVNNDALAIPWLMGKLIINPTTNTPGYFEMLTPSHTLGMQFLAYYGLNTKDLVFFSTEDDQGYYKRFALNVQNNGIGWTVIHYPENHITADIDYEAPFPTTIAVFDGDWFDVAKLYRSWVIGSDIMNRGKLKDSNQISPAFDDIDLHATYPETNDEFILNEVDDWLDFINECPDSNIPNYACDSENEFDKVLVEVYNWHAGNFWSIWPTGYKPMVSDIYNLTKILHQRGHLIMPYFLPLGYSVNLSTFGSTVMDNAYINESGQTPVYPIEGAPAYSYVAIDPSTTWWQLLTKNIMLDLADFGDDSPSYNNVGFDGSYWDVWSGETPKLDYSTTHGHPQGGGDYWIQGEINRIELVRNILEQVNPNWIMSSEIPTETYLNYLEFVQWNSPQREVHPTYNIPLYQTVFHDYVGTATIVATAPNVAINNNIDHSSYVWAIYYTYGIFPSINHVGSGAGYTFPIQNPGIQNEFFYFLKKLFRSQFYAEDYIKYGELMRPLELDVDDTIVTGITTYPGSIATNIFYENHYPDIPNVLSSVWKASDGSLGIALVNWRDDDENVEFVLEFGDYSLGVGEEYILSKLIEVNETPLRVANDDFLFNITVRGRDLLFLKFAEDSCGNNYCGEDENPTNCPDDCGSGLITPPPPPPPPPTAQPTQPRPPSGTVTPEPQAQTKTPEQIREEQEKLKREQEAKLKQEKTEKRNKLILWFVIAGLLILVAAFIISLVKKETKIE